MRIGIAADQSALQLKESIVTWLRKEQHLTVDYGAHPDCPADDFLHHALALTWAISRGTVERGILLSDSGIGGAIIANKIPGVRAGFTLDPASLRHAMVHDHMNVYSLWSSRLELSQILELVDIFISSPYSDDVASKRRIARLAALESRFPIC